MAGAQGFRPLSGFLSTSPIHPGANLLLEVAWNAGPGMVSFKVEAKLNTMGSAAPSLLMLSKAFY